VRLADFVNPPRNVEHVSSGCFLEPGCVVLHWTFTFDQAPPCDHEGPVEVFGTRSRLLLGGETGGVEATWLLEIVPYIWAVVIEKGWVHVVVEQGEDLG
jgi:hypothetical protein